MREASYYQQERSDHVRCLLCPHHCLIAPGKSGICGARSNREGKLFSLNSRRVTALSIDPIEKKPLYHYYPGSHILSLGTAGCNLHCPFCQNDSISRFFDRPDSDISQTEQYTPEDLLSQIKHRPGHFQGAAFTYSEPSVWFESILDYSKILKQHGLHSVWVTNGFIEKDPLNEILPYIDAANIDLKTFSEKQYRSLGGSLQPVLNTIDTLFKAGKHIEITTLAVTDFNDSIDEIKKTAEWIASKSPDIPYHISRYFPHYQYRKPATDIDFMHRAVDKASEYLHYVYGGNFNTGQDTRCSGCGTVLIKRSYLGIEYSQLDLVKHICKNCGKKINIEMPK